MLGNPHPWATFVIVVAVVVLCVWLPYAGHGLRPKWHLPIAHPDTRNELRREMRAAEQAELAELRQTAERWLLASQTARPELADVSLASSRRCSDVLTFTDGSRVFCSPPGKIWTRLLAAPLNDHQRQPLRLDMTGVVAGETMLRFVDQQGTVWRVWSKRVTVIPGRHAATST